MTTPSKSHAKFLLATLAVLNTQVCRAEDPPEKASIAIKYLDYFDKQPDKDRIRVKATAIGIVAPLSPEWSISTTTTTDGISGASPAFHNSAITKMHDRRNAVDAALTRYFGDGSLTLGSAYSHESDYVSKAVTMQASISSEDRNTTWSAGVGLSVDSINPNNKIVQDQSKHVTDFLLGVSQVLTPVDIVQLNLGMANATGYMSDPYKVFDNRPDRRSHTMTLRWNHHLDKFDATSRFSYRYYGDDWSIKSHTFGLEYVQNFSDGWSVTPLLRLYSQSAAKFYIDAGPYGFPFPPNPPEGAIYFSEDQRLSAYGAHTVGFKITKNLGDDWVVDFKYEKYEQRSNWRLFGDGSPGLLPFSARSFQVGLARSF